jgi:hypothetical protein
MKTAFTLMCDYDEYIQGIDSENSTTLWKQYLLERHGLKIKEGMTPQSESVF